MAIRINASDAVAYGDGSDGGFHRDLIFEDF